MAGAAAANRADTSAASPASTSATPLAFTGLAAAAAFRMNLFNIGGEGQLYFGAIFAALALWQSYYALFIGGILLADLTRQLNSRKSANLMGGALCGCGLFVSLLLNPWFDFLYIASAMLLTAGVAYCIPIRSLFENRLSDFLGWISYPLYLVQAAVIYSFSLWGLDALSGSGLDPSTQRWMVDLATLPLAFLVAIAFSPANDFAVILSRKFGAMSLKALDRLSGRPPQNIRPAPLL